MLSKRHHEAVRLVPPQSHPLVLLVNVVHDDVDEDHRFDGAVQKVVGVLIVLVLLAELVGKNEQLGQVLGDPCDHVADETVRLQPDVVEVRFLLNVFHRGRVLQFADLLFQLEY